MSDLKAKLGSKIQKLRKSKKLTQEKLAEMIDLDIPNISNIERGKRFMTAETLEKIANALTVTIKDLFDFEDENYNEEKLKENITTNLEYLSLNQLNFLRKTINNLMQI